MKVQVLIQNGQIDQVQRDRSTAERIRNARPYLAIEEYKVLTAMVQCEAQQVEKSARLRCLLPDRHDGPHQFGKMGI